MSITLICEKCKQNLASCSCVRTTINASSGIPPLNRTIAFPKLVAISDLTDEAKQEIRAIVREEMTQVLTLIKDKPEISQVVYQDDSKNKAFIKLEMGGKTYSGLVTLEGSIY